MDGQKGLAVDILSAAKPNEAMLEEISNMQKDGLGKQDSLNAAVESLKNRTFGSQAETSVQLTQIQSILSDIRLDQERTRSHTFLEDLPRSVLVPIFRTELKRIVIPVVEESLSHNKSHFDLQVDRIHHGIDQTAQSLGQILEDRPTVDRHSWMQSPVQTVFESARPEEEVRHSQGLSERENLSLDDFRPSTDCQGDHLDTWSRTWTYMSSVGTFCVRVSTSRIRSKVGAKSKAFGHSTSAWSEEVWNLFISFQPVHRMLSKGVSLTIGSRSDQCGHYFRCPEISTFAIISRDSNVFVLAVAGDAQGLKRLFAENLASPTDRNEKGHTVLHVG